MAEQHDDEHAQHIGPHAHLPDPSVWPFVVGAAILLVGAGLVWWARDPDSAFAGPLLGAAIVAALASIGGWAYEDGKMKRMAEEYEHKAPRNARFTQVITFAISEGQYANATSDQGVLHRIEASDSDLRNLAGFQDLRIIASPSETGPSQVLVETTWSDREGLATYDETRQTVLDIVNEFSDQVLPGSVQVFDMIVVRDTKDVAVRFGLGTAATLIGGLAIGGLLIGAGITLFEGDAAPATNGPAPPAGFEETGIIVGDMGAGGGRFAPNAISLPPETEVTLTFDNRDGMHNIEFFDGESADAPLLTGCLEGCTGDEVQTSVAAGPIQQTFTFVTPGPGRYFYHCVIHPVDMVGFLTVEEGAPVPGGPAPGPGNGEEENGEAENGDAEADAAE